MSKDKVRMRDSNVMASSSPRATILLVQRNQLAMRGAFLTRHLFTISQI